MKKTTALLFSLLLLSNNVKAQNASIEDSSALDITTCTGIMTSEELLKAAKGLQNKNDSDADFFASNCIMIAAHKGDADAQLELGKIYKNGIGTPPSDVFAYKWFKIAELNGKDIDKDEIIALEESMNTNDFKLASSEVSNYIEFERKIGQSNDSNYFKKLLMNTDYKDISPDQLKEIEEKNREIEDMFNNSIAKTVSEKSDNSYNPIPSQDFSGMPQQQMNIPHPADINMQSYMPSNMNEMPMMAKGINSAMQSPQPTVPYPTQPPISVPPYIPQMQRGNEQIPAYPQGYTDSYGDMPPEAREAMMSYQKENNNKKSSGPQQIDFLTDVYNPQFAPPPSQY